MLKLLYNKNIKVLNYFSKASWKSGIYSGFSGAKAPIC